MAQTKSISEKVALHPTLNGFNPERFLRSTGLGKVLLPFRKGESVFVQGDDCDAIYNVQEGSLKLTVVSGHGKEATIALLNRGDFIGEECLATTQQFRTCSASAMTDSVVLKITKAEMMRVLRDESAMSNLFVAYLLAKNSRIQADLVDQLFNSTEKRLARTLLLLANFGKEGVAETLVPQISQETLAAMIGCTRSRVNFFLNRFRKLGFIEYDDRIRVHKSLLQIVLHD